MKSLFTALLFLISCSFISAQNTDNEKLVGSWALAVFKYTLPDTVISGDSKVFNSVKVLDKSYFAYVGKSLPDHIFKRAGAGRYELSGDTLTEIIDFSSIANMLGKTFKYKCRIEGDTWYISGLINDIYVEEIWKRLK
jgi:hypothetical protein